MASAEEVERALLALMERLDDASPDPESIPDRTIKCVVLDLDVAYLSRITDARFDGLDQVAMTEPADVVVSARSGDLIALIDGRLNVGFAFLTGKVRVDASTRDLMMIRNLF